jgi:hypothetical protein
LPLAGLPLVPAPPVVPLPSPPLLELPQATARVENRTKIETVARMGRPFAKETAIEAITTFPPQDTRQARPSHRND